MTGTQSSQELAARARAALHAQPAPPTDEILDLAKKLKNALQFALARRMLGLLGDESRLDPALRRNAAYERAVCTYKDSEIPSDIRFDQALAALQRVEDLRTTTDPEALGIAGAIHKRTWEVDAQKQHLESALGFYLRGYQQGIASDRGYTAINAAFTLDLLANEEEAEARRSNSPSENAAEHRRRAAAIRADIVDHLPTMLADLDSSSDVAKWWAWVTVAEAFFGLGRYDEAEQWLQKAAPLQVPEWARESTLRQLVQLVFHRAAGEVTDTSWRAIKTLVPSEPAALRSAVVGKVGLALSGGGFRASLFHIGVLARLAELDVLRHVEVLSCVSGGSIIGTHFYLEVRRLLQSKPDTLITREDFIDIVKRMERDFLAGVQRNIRVRALSRFADNLRMLLHPTFTLTRRIGLLLETEIYSRVDDGQGAAPRWISDLRIIPHGEAPDYAAEDHNWRRGAKVPQLILNATTLNTCHNWQFTTTSMGEPSSRIDTDADANPRLRRMRYADAPSPYQRMPLGEAVAASACVAGLLPPVLLPGLYPAKTIALADGGIHDNQGAATLLDADCTVLLVSDASRHVAVQNAPNIGLLSLAGRTTSILIDRLRQARYRELTARQRSSRLRGLMFIHLKKELEIYPIDWIGCDDPAPSDAKEPPAAMSSYGIRKDIQQLLSTVRTDLDSFCDIEAFALMTCGYRMTERFFPDSVGGFAEAPPAKVDWRFLTVAPALRGEQGADRLRQVLRVAAHRGFKIWSLDDRLSRISHLLLPAAIIALLAIIWLSIAHLHVVQKLGVAAITIFAAMIVGGILLILWSIALRALHIRKSAIQIALDLAMCTFGWIVASLHLWLFDPLYLAWGRVDKKDTQNG
jgi:predicted acylesterase/phospholipase RssA/tetratricopeptide (TPR) repeat protein